MPIVRLTITDKKALVEGEIGSYEEEGTFDVQLDADRYFDQQKELYNTSYGYTNTVDTPTKQTWTSRQADVTLEKVDYS